MVSPGRLFNTPPGVRMSPGKKRVLFRPKLNSIHAALTRASAAFAEFQNIQAQMMEASVHKRAAHNRQQAFFYRLTNYQNRMRSHPSESYQKIINHAQKELNAITPIARNKERTYARLVKQWENSKKRYHKLARRVIHLKGNRNLNNRLLTSKEKEAIRVTAAIVKNMSAAQRTTRRLPLPRNVGNVIIRSLARR